MRSGITSDSIACTSFNLLALPVTKTTDGRQPEVVEDEENDVDNDEEDASLVKGLPI